MNTSAKSEHTGNSGFKKEVLEWVKILLAAAAIAFVLNTFVIANSYIPSGSMENTIMTGDRIIGSSFHTPSERSLRGGISYSLTTKRSRARTRPGW